MQIEKWKIERINIDIEGKEDCNMVQLGYLFSSR
jgi:hypothetical protein